MKPPRAAGLGRRTAPFFLGSILALLASDGWSQRRHAPPPPYGAQPSEEEGRAALARFRRLGIAGDYALAFELRVLPRRGAERVLEGMLRGGRTIAGPVSLVSLAPPKEMAGSDLRLLVHSGPQPQVWRRSPDGIHVYEAKELFKPIFDTDLTAFDLQMPFLYWEDYTYKGLVRIRGRPTHQYEARPPAELSEEVDDLGSVMLFVDAQFDAMVQAEILNPKGAVMKTITIQDLKKIGDQWVARTLDLRNEVTRDKTRFAVTQVALDLQWPPSLFLPSALDEPLPAVPPERLTPLD